MTDETRKAAKAAEADCTHCGEQGHTATECPKPRAKVWDDAAFGPNGDPFEGLS